MRTYLTALAGSYEWLELRGIPEAETLLVELEKVYIALKTEPETDYDLHHLANLHSIEVEEAAGGISLDLIDPVRLAELDAENVRRTYRPRREEARLGGVTDVTDIAAAVRLHRRMVILGGPGSGKTTLGHWLALQFARQMLKQAPHEVAPESAVQGLPETARLRVPAGTAISFSASHFVPPEQADTTSAIRIEALPKRGKLALRGARVLGIASSANADWLRAHGAVPVPYGDGLAERLRAAAGSRIDAFIDLFGPEYVQLAVELGITRERIETITSFQKAQELGVKADGSGTASTPEVLTEMADLVASGAIEIPIAATYSLDGVADAFEELERRHTRGKIVLIP